MATAVIMPKQGQSVESCIIGQWHKKPGEKVSVGDVLFTYETDKSIFDEEAKIEGTLLAVFYEEGDEAECLQTVCVIGNEGEDIEQFTIDNSQLTIDNSQLRIKNEKLGYNQDVHQPVHASQPVGRDALGAPLAPNSQFSILNSKFSPRVSPRARALAERTKADISKAVGTGAGGRIMERDIRKAIAQGHRTTRAVQETDAPRTDVAHLRQERNALEEISFEPKTDDFEVVKLTNIRKIIAQRMSASLQNSAQLTQHSSFDATNIIEYRNRLKAAMDSNSAAKLTITDIIIYALSRVLPKHKAINAWFMGSKIAMCENAHIGVAVDTPKGLLVPTIFNANKMSLPEISACMKDLAERCKAGNIKPDMLEGATFTVSNLGALGVEVFTPILNPPQTGILGVCSMIERTKDGKPYKAIGLSVTYDHRALDGADAARFSKDLTEYLENFDLEVRG